MSIFHEFFSAPTPIGKIRSQPFFRTKRELQLKRLKRDRAEAAKHLSKINTEIAKLS